MILVKPSLGDRDGNFVNYGSNFCNESEKRWNSRLAVEETGFSFANNYRQGRLRLALELDGPWSRRDYVLLACLAGKEAVGDSHLSMTIRDGDPGECGDSEQEPVLIYVGELVEAAYVPVPSAVVGLYLVSKKSLKCLGDGALFCSLIDGLYKAVTVVPDGKEYLSAGYMRLPDGSRVTVIESGSKISDRITEDEANNWVNVLGSKLNATLARLKIKLDAKNVSILRNRGNGVLQCSDVLFGPIYL